MSGAFVGSNAKAILDQLTAAMAVQNLIGSKPASEVAGPDRIVWVYQGDAGYEEKRPQGPFAAKIIWYAAELYLVKLWGADVFQAQELRGKLLKALELEFSKNAYRPLRATGSGDTLQNGYLLELTITLYVPIVFEQYSEATVSGGTAQGYVTDPVGGGAPDPIPNG